MKITGFIASPRREGNAAWAVNKILERAKEQGVEIHSLLQERVNYEHCH